METKRLVRIALFSVILFVSQVALAGIPNCEMVSLLIIVLTLVYGKDIIYSTFVFALLEMMVYGAGLWVLMYFYIWPLLCLITLILKRFIKESFSLWAVVSGMFGLLFGTLCTLIYFPLGKAYMLAYWISGLPWDVWHGFTNFVIMVLIGKGLYEVILKIERRNGE